MAFQVIFSNQDGRQNIEVHRSFRFDECQEQESRISEGKEVHENEGPEGKGVHDNEVPEKKEVNEIKCPEGK